ncbi:MAG: TetR/AcrR family transcriptional regulator [Pseudopedobacter saltans]|uniref:TetR/AcrR family transcriptional regulator n=1 Tax=Pseudopedobacter saltans TaxID=151895 RepID=A0A2W5EKD7_9SPHI|nr:MAG: TetR/AcrR family transcriptional regulator [Pseudopedobacter saltans]
MTKREEILQTADQLMMEKGYNAFSFYDIAEKVGIKTASIHYHFPAKKDLGIAIITQHKDELVQVFEKYAERSPVDKLELFFKIYTRVKQNHHVCIMGSLASDVNTISEDMRDTLQDFCQFFMDWLSDALEEGRTKKLFQFEGTARIKAMMIYTNMMGVVQMNRLTDTNDLEMMKEQIRTDLKIK